MRRAGIPFAEKVEVAMIPAYIIEELREREAKRAEQSRPRVQIELEIPSYPPTRVKETPTPPSRGIEIITVWGEEV